MKMLIWIITFTFALSFCSLAWSQTEKIVFVHELNGNNDLWIMNTDGSGAQALLATPTSQEWGPRFSHNGRLISFVSNASGHDEVWLMNSDGSNPHQLTNTASMGNDSLVHWAPASPWFPGDSLLAYGVRRGCCWGLRIYAIRPDGTSNRVLIDSPNNLDYLPSVNPANGCEVTHNSDPGDWGPDADHVLTNVCNGTTRMIIPGSQPGTQGLVDWSPNGSRLLMEELLGSGGLYPPANLWSIDPFGGNRVQLTFSMSESEAYTLSQYSPDGSHIVCMRSGYYFGAPTSIYVLNAADGTDLHQIYAPLTGSVSCPDWGVVSSCPDWACNIPAGIYRGDPQDGWGQDICQGYNTACFRDRHFRVIYPNGITVGIGHTLTFTNAPALAAALPTTGTPSALHENLVNPLRREFARGGGILAGEVVALKLNVGYGASGRTVFHDLQSLVVSRASVAFLGMSVEELLVLSERVLGGDLNALPVGETLQSLNIVLAHVNANFESGLVSHGYLVEACCDAIPTTPPAHDGITPNSRQIGRLDVTGSPFNPVITIRYQLNVAGDYTLAVYNLTGQLVTTLFSGSAQPGEYSVVWDGRSASGVTVASGQYFVRLASASEFKAGKLLLVK